MWQPREYPGSGLGSGAGAVRRSLALEADYRSLRRIAVLEAAEKRIVEQLLHVRLDAVTYRQRCVPSLTDVAHASPYESPTADAGVRPVGGRLGSGLDR